jgi:hypothetical protein
MVSGIGDIQIAPLVQRHTFWFRQLRKMSRSGVPSEPSRTVPSSRPDVPVRSDHAYNVIPPIGDVQVAPVVNRDVDWPI